MKKSLAFTLAEVLITLAIIGVVAAMTIPSVIVNTNQSEFKTGLKKAVSVLNQSITMNGALEGETPYDNENLFDYLQQHMSVMSSTSAMPWKNSQGEGEYADANANLAFYTTDGMRFEIPTHSIELTVHENVTENDAANGVTSGSAGTAKIKFNNKVKSKDDVEDGLKDNETAYVGPTNRIGGCGSYGYKADSDSNAGNTPCLILVDVNGDRKPTPSNANGESKYVYPNVGDKLVRDIFPIIITDEKAIPYGVVAQKAMYQARDKKTSK